MYNELVKMQDVSFTEENYLKIIYKLSSESGTEVSTNAVAELAQIKAASVSDMLRKLSEKNLVSYQKYQGVTLTETGRLVALKVIRKHRLWEVFLVKILKFDWDEVHEIAEQLEHIHSDDLVEKLDNFLDYPQFDPHGDPIPDKEGNMPVVKSKALSEITEGITVFITGVTEHSPLFLKHLDKVGLQLGCVLKISELHDFDKSLIVELKNGEKTFVSYEVAKHILVN